MTRITNTCDADLIVHAPSGVVTIKAKQSLEVSPKQQKEIAAACANYVTAGFLIVEGRDPNAEAEAKAAAEAMAKAQADAIAAANAEAEAKAKAAIKK